MRLSTGYVAKTAIVSHNQHVMARCTMYLLLPRTGDKAPPETGRSLVPSLRVSSLSISSVARYFVPLEILTLELATVLEPQGGLRSQLLTIFRFVR